MRLKEASLKEIDLEARGWDDFIFTYKPDIGEIAASLKRLGQINPVILEEMEKDASHPKGRYRIVAGYARVLAAKKIGWEKIEAKIFDAGEIPTRKLFFLALRIPRMLSIRGTLATKASGGNISAVEKALALKKAIDLFGFEEEEVRREIAPLVDVPPSKEVIRNYISLAEADEALKDAVHFDRFSASQAFLLLPFKAADRLALFNLLQNLSANFNETKEILRNISDLAKLQKRPIKEILALEEIKGILPDETLSPGRKARGGPARAGRRQKTENVRQVLKKLRYPLLSQAEEQLRKRIKALALNPVVHLAYDPSFEKEEITISLKVTDEDKLACALKSLGAALAAGKFARIFSLLRGEDRQRG